MSGYFADRRATAEVLSPEGWLDTGDIGYRITDDIVVTGRKKDLIIVNGRNIGPQDLENLAELVPEVRPGDACAFSVTSPNEVEIAVMVVQYRGSDPTRRAHLIKNLQNLIREDLGVDCFIEIVSPHTLPRTSSGKLSRTRSREEFLTRVDWGSFDAAVTGTVNSRSTRRA